MTDNHEIQEIVIITPSKFPGTAGDTANYSEIIAELAKKYRISVICPPSDSDRQELFFPAKVQIIRIPFSPPRLKDIKLKIGIRNLTRLTAFSILQCFTIIWFLARTNTKNVYMRHALLTLPVPFLLRLLRKNVIADGEIFSQSLEAIHISGRLKNALNHVERSMFRTYAFFRVSTNSQAKRINSWGYPHEKILLLPMGVNLDQIPIVPLRNIPMDTFGFFGALEKWQGPDILIKAFKIVISRIPTAKLYIIGDGSLKKTLIDYAKNNDLNASVIFVDGVTRKQIWEDYFKRFRVAVIPRPNRDDFFDSLPSIKLIESLAARKPVIASDIEAMREVPPGIITLVSPNDPVSLAEAMCVVSASHDTQDEASEVVVDYLKQHDIRESIGKLEKCFI